MLALIQVEIQVKTIHHCHIHLIPRRNDDITEPQGGLRNIITSKANYP